MESQKVGKGETRGVMDGGNLKVVRKSSQNEVRDG